MALLLDRLGRWCAEHAWPVVAAWLAVLALLGVGAGTLGRPLTTEITIPDAPFTKVADRLRAEVPVAAGGSGTVVLTNGGAPLTGAQRDTVRDVVRTWERLPHVTRVVDPFATQADLDSRARQVADGRVRLDAAKRQLDAARTRLADGESRLAGGRALLADLEARNPADPGLPGLRAQLATGEAQLRDGRAAYERGLAEYTAGERGWSDGAAVVAGLRPTRFVSEDETAALVQVQFDTNTHSLPLEVREAVPAAAKDRLAAAGVRADYSVDITQETKLVGPGEVVGLLVAGLVLLATLGTLVAAGLPILAALVGVGAGLAGAMAATRLFEMTTMTPALALMLGLAVGIDYTLFIVNRHRTQLLDGMDPVRSIGRAVGTAGSAVTFAGATVVVALVALVLSGIPFLAQMGLVAAGTVAASVVVTLTLTPAVLRLVGTRVLTRRAWRARGWQAPGDASRRVVPAGDHEEEHGGAYVRALTRRPVLALLGVVLVVGVMAWPALDLRLGLPDGSAQPRTSTAYAAYDAVEKRFGPGMNGPVVAILDLDAPVPQDGLVAKQAEFSRQVMALTGVRSVVPIGTNADRSSLAFQVVPTTGPAEAETATTLDTLRATGGRIGASLGGTVGFTGQTVANIEISEILGGALPLYLAVVVGMSLLILMAVFRSVVVPLVATGGFLLSVAAAFGATVAVFQWGWFSDVVGTSRPGPILSFMPIMLIGILFGLAMDYQMFLVTGMAEAYAHGEDSRRAVVTGFVHGAKVVSAAAVIMAAVFGGFVFSHMVEMRHIGLGLAVGVLVDALLVRMTFTPALMYLLRERAWWIPAWLDRLLPDLDVEGTSLRARDEEEAAAAAAPDVRLPVPSGR